MEYKKLINKARKAREAAGMTQKQVAEALGLKQQQIQRLETDGNTPSLRAFCEYCEAVGLVVTVRHKKGGNPKDPQ